MANRILISNDGAGKGFVYEELTISFHPLDLDAVAADVAGTVWLAEFAGEVMSVRLAVQTNSTAASTDLQAEISKNGTLVTSTHPKITDGAGTGKRHTISTATGITLGVVKTDGTQNFVVGDLFTSNFNVTGTGPNGVGYVIQMVVRRTAEANA